MIRRISLTFGLIAFVFFAYSQTISLNKKVLASGGEISSNTETQLGLTVGQTFIGKVFKGDTQSGVGFWYSASKYLTSVEYIAEPISDSEIVLVQNYPNPFNQFTIIDFSIDKRSYITLKVFDLNGRFIDKLMEERMHPGQYKVSYFADKLSTGVYIYELRVNERIYKKRMICIKQ